MLRIPGPLPYPPRTLPWGDCSREARLRESAEGIERDSRALDDERCENHHGHRRETVATRARDARLRALTRRTR